MAASRRRHRGVAGTRLFGRVGPATCRRRRIERGVGVTEIVRREGVVPPDLNEVAAGNAKRSWDYFDANQRARRSKPLTVRRNVAWKATFGGEPNRFSCRTANGFQSRSLWSPHIQQGRAYDTAEADGRRLWESIMDQVATRPDAPIVVPRYGEPVLIRPRLGQGAFRIGVTGVYQRRCAVTGERTLPILDAAHIRPYGAGGDHEITNGLLLRTDVHRLFDLGYVTVSGDGRFQVGRRLKEDFENGRHYYSMHGKPVALPNDAAMRPAHDALEWHQSNKFLG